MRCAMRCFTENALQLAMASYTCMYAGTVHPSSCCYQLHYKHSSHIDKSRDDITVQLTSVSQYMLTTCLHPDVTHDWTFYV